MWKNQRHFCLVNVSLNMFEPYTSTPFHTIFLITYGNGGTYWEWEPSVDKESISFLYDAVLVVPGAFLTTATPMNSDASGQPLLGNKVQRILRSINCAKHEKVGYAMPSQQVVQSDRNHGRCRCNRHAVDSDTTKPFNSPSVSIVSTAGSGVLLVEWTMWRQRPSTSSLSPTRLAPIFSRSFNMKGASSAKAKLGYGK